MAYILDVIIIRVTILAYIQLGEVKTEGGRVSSVGIATRNGLDGPGIESRWG